MSVLNDDAVILVREKLNDCPETLEFLDNQPSELVELFLEGYLELIYDLSTMELDFGYSSKLEPTEKF